MGIDAMLQDENGKPIQEVFDPGSLLQRLLPHDDEESICLRFINPYGDTTFNQLQIPILFEELENAVRNTKDTEAKKQGLKVLELARKGAGKPHLYIKFSGD